MHGSNIFFGYSAPAGGVINTKLVSEAMLLSEQALASSLRGRINAESTVTLDQTGFGVLRGRTASEPVAVADSILQLSMIRGRVASEAITVTEQISSSRFLFRSLSEAVTVIETVIKSISAGVIFKTVTDVLDVIDSATATLLRTRAGGEQVNVIDIAAASRLVSSRISDNLGVTDQRLATLLRGRLFGEVVTPADFAVRTLIRMVLASEQLTITDQYLKFRLLTRGLLELLEVDDEFISNTVYGGVTFDVRIRLSEARTIVQLGHDPVTRLGSDSLFIVLGGY